MSSCRIDLSSIIPLITALFGSVVFLVSESDGQWPLADAQQAGQTADPLGLWCLSTLFVVV